MDHKELDIIITLLEPYDSLGMLPPNLLRNLRIRRDYIELRRMGHKGCDAKREISERYCTGIKNIETILYSRSGYAKDR